MLDAAAPLGAMSPASARRLAYILNATAGGATGLTLVTYLKWIGDAAQPVYGVYNNTASTAYLAVCFLLEYGLQTYSGAWADRVGTRKAMLASFFLRTFYPLLLVSLPKVAT